MEMKGLFLLSFLSTAWAFAPSCGVMRSVTELFATRKPFISGNWKLNPQTREEAITLASEISAAIGPDSPDADVALFVPYVFIEAAMKAAGGKLSIGAEVRFVSTVCRNTSEECLQFIIFLISASLLTRIFILTHIYIGSLSRD